MSRHRTGSVLTQQTVLGFSDQPPSPFGATDLPQCITDQRGGQHSFAMNQHTQLQFNLGIPPHPTNLATHFNPSHPTPVVIKKSSFVVNGGAFSTISAKKLALAVRLAKRDLRLGRSQPPTPSPQLCHCCRNEQSAQSTVRCDINTVGVQEPQTPVQTDTGPTETKAAVKDSENPLPHRTPRHSNKRTLPMPDDELCLLLVDKEGNQRRDDRSSQEVLRLRKELQRQVAYIKQLRELGRGLGHMTSARQDNNKRGGRRVRGGRMVESGRVWMEEMRGEEEKLLQREEEQAARNARTIYTLSHQLSHLQQNVQRLQLNERPDNTKKSQATRRLAAIYRSALRLLQNYQSPGHTPQPLPPELALLLQQLSLLSHHFGVGGAKSELDATIRLLQELVEQGKENEPIARQSVQEKNIVSRKPVMQKQNKVRSTKKTSVLFHPQVAPRSVRARRGRTGQPHFARQTLSSQSRRQPPKQTVYSPPKHSPALLHSSTPFTGQSEGQKERYYRSVQQSAKKPPLNGDLTSLPPNTDRVGEDTPRQGNSTSYPVLNLPTDVSTGGSSSLTNRPRMSTSAPSVVTDDKRAAKIALSSPVDGHSVPGDGVSSPVVDEQRLWMESISATLAHHSQQLETFKKNTQKQLGHLEQNLSSQRKARKKNAENAPSPDDEIEESVENEGVSYDGMKLDGLMERLRELEGEEDMIRERWRTITYEDPPLAKPPIVHCSGEQPSNIGISPPPGISDDALQRITSYRQRFQHHLQMTGHNTQGGFNPWIMAEKLADELLSEVVDEVSEELGELCDGYVDRLFSNEFARPPTPTLL